MNFKKNRHYTNEHGVELNEYLKHNFNYEELAGWYTMQVLKYLVRAGKKDGESYDKDYNKALDYANELANLSNENKLTHYTTEDIMGFIQELADDFKQWSYFISVFQSLMTLMVGWLKVEDLVFSPIFLRANVINGHKKKLINMK